MASEHTINVLLATFAGLGLPRTLSLPTRSSASVSDVYDSVLNRLPALDESLILTTVSNKQLLPSNHESITTLLSSPSDSLLSLRLSRQLCGGKGGFGSQLRAAGGRMSSRKNRQNQNVNGSNRNLDGRRLRTVDEAKKLAEYLAVKPEMEKKEREERKKRWEAVVEASERREEEIRSGKGGANQGRLNAEYVESKEEAENKTREAVLKAMREGLLQSERTGSESSENVEEDDSEGEEEESSDSSDDPKAEASTGSKFFGWDEDEDEDDDDDESEEDEQAEPVPSYEGKGKGRA
ncbi:hypothetical protein M409DRAFT_50605 [Zasmidium cellare ATCC 36951]|uniref:Uncharacterized protein n=1 Tax=Zasmidium cellare ATCC 36951 TaxID=1080233 RepID=A0A6A6CY77_ZASCE|nr:uncharacterized protein M409DRAFT_50605 [Zasmidium cellare ATCC 36951]KAF2172005.1 hypothetical protein M409DRAFT_50605 [Zasmidium cellare ATCC 36951]